jgi:hypothetical protein
VLNPIPLFTTDNNGSIIKLPSVAAGGTTTVSGSVIFGIDTESNNASGSSDRIDLGFPGQVGTSPPPSARRHLTTSFIDSGSNGLFFNDINQHQSEQYRRLQQHGFLRLLLPGEHVASQRHADRARAARVRR